LGKTHPNHGIPPLALKIHVHFTIQNIFIPSRVPSVVQKSKSKVSSETPDKLSWEPCKNNTDSYMLPRYNGRPGTGQTFLFQKGGIGE
jgi:hypothetical protein